MEEKRKRLRDVNQLAKLISDIATGQVEDMKTADGKNLAAVSLGRRGGLIGGKVRANRLTAEKRSQIAKLAADVRWSRKPE